MSLEKSWEKYRKAIEVIGSRGIGVEHDGFPKAIEQIKKAAEALLNSGAQASAVYRMLHEGQARSDRQLTLVFNMLGQAVLRESHPDEDLLALMLTSAELQSQAAGVLQARLSELTVDTLIALATNGSLNSEVRGNAADRLGDMNTLRFTWSHLYAMEGAMPGDHRVWADRVYTKMCAARVRQRLDDAWRIFCERTAEEGRLTRKDFDAKALKENDTKHGLYRLADLPLKKAVNKIWETVMSQWLPY